MTNSNLQPRKVTIERTCSQRTGDAVIKRQVDFIVGRALGSSRGACWEYRVKRSAREYRAAGISEYGWKFRADITFEKVRGRHDPDIEQRQWDAIARFLSVACSDSKFGKYPWAVVSGIGKLEMQGDEETDAVASEIKDYGTIELVEERGDHFAHIFEREPQIEVVLSAIAAARDSEFRNRFHTVLHGPPGCGKSEILLAVGRMLGEENEAYLKVDATSTTEAGISKLLLEAETIPPVLIIEEIEKTDERSLRWLLGVLDQRAEIRRVNARIGHRARNVKLLCLATVNNMALFRKAMSGALASRFSHEVYCPRPSWKVLGLILMREVQRADGDPRWIEPALLFCGDQKITDPRKVIPICLCGRDALLDGSYQKTLLAIRQELRRDEGQAKAR